MVDDKVSKYYLCKVPKKIVFFKQKMWNASRFCVSSLRRGHANLLCFVPILVYVFRRSLNCSPVNDLVVFRFVLLLQFPDQAKLRKQVFQMNFRV